MGRKKKQPTRVLVSDQEYIRAFTRGNEPGAPFKKKDPPVNKHGVPVVDEICFSTPAEIVDGKEIEPREQDFSSLLEASFNQGGPAKRTLPAPVPYKKRIKRYPPPETELDLHGYTALGAEIRAKSFLITCRQQGYFTVRIIVGRGLHSDGGPVLPDVVEDVLNALKKEQIILGYQWDKRKKAKSGAVIVYIRQFND